MGNRKLTGNETPIVSLTSDFVFSQTLQKVGENSFNPIESGYKFEREREKSNRKGCLERGQTRISDRVLSIASPASLSITLLNLTMFPAASIFFFSSLPSFLSPVRRLFFFFLKKRANQETGVKRLTLNANANAFNCLQITTLPRNILCFALCMVL